MRDQTEWVELVEAGANELVGANSYQLAVALQRPMELIGSLNLYGDGTAATKIAKCLRSLKVSAT